MLEKAKEQGYPGLQWTDPFHPGFELKIQMNRTGELDGSKDVTSISVTPCAPRAVGEPPATCERDGKTAPHWFVTFTHGIGTHAPRVRLSGRRKYRWLTFYAGSAPT